MAKTVAKQESVYERAAAIWVERRYNYKAGSVSEVNFVNYVGGYCETCGYETLGLEFKLNGKFTERELGYYDITPGKFIEECVAILDEM